MRIVLLVMLLTSSLFSNETISVSVDKLIKDYSNEIKGDFLYKDKWLYINGVIGSIRKTSGVISLSLYGEKSNLYDPDSIDIIMSDKYIDWLITLDKGDFCKIKVYCKGKSSEKKQHYFNTRAKGKFC